MEKISRNLKDWKKEEDIYKWEINNVSWLEFYSNDDGTYSIENWAKYCDTPEFWIDDATSLDNAIDRVEKYWKALENVNNIVDAMSIMFL